MATSAEYIGFVCERLYGFGNVKSRKMFGEYMVYINEKPVFTVCDNTVFVKALPYLDGIMKGAQMCPPYPGAKNAYVLDIEDEGLVEKVVNAILENA